MKRVHEAFDFWVPEDHCFETAEECLEKFPDAGPAVGCLKAEDAQAKQKMMDVLDEKCQEIQKLKVHNQLLLEANAEQREAYKLARQAYNILRKKAGLLADVVEIYVRAKPNNLIINPNVGNEPLKEFRRLYPKEPS